MKKALLFLFFFLFSSYMIAQDTQSRKDGYVVVSLSKSVDNDTKYEIISNSGTTCEMLRSQGRYIVSMVYTKFGLVVVHKKNTEAIEQIFDNIPAYKLKQKLKEHFKNGFSVSYYNSQQHYAIFDKNPKITTQDYVKDINQKKLDKYNSKGLYYKHLWNTDGVVQNGHDFVIQHYASFIAHNAEVETLKHCIEYLQRGWKVESFYSSYNQYGDWNQYKMILDKSQDAESSLQEMVGIINTEGELSKFLSEYKSSGYTLSSIWCGWEPQDYSKRYTSSDDSESFLDILGGLISTGSKLASGNVTDTPTQSYSDSSTNYTSDSPSSSSSSKSSSSQTSKVNHANWKSLDNSYNGYESQLIRMSNSSSINKQEVRNIQKKMKEIRQKIYQQSGHQRAVSQWENWNP